MNQTFSNYLLEKYSKISSNYTWDDFLTESCDNINLDNIFIIKMNLSTKEYTLVHSGNNSAPHKINQSLCFHESDIKKSKNPFISNPFSILKKEKLKETYNFNPKIFYIADEFIFGFSGKNTSLNYNLFLTQIATLYKSYNYKSLESNNIEEKSNKLKEEFLSKISHEIRTPLNAILGNTKLLLDSYSNDKRINQINSSSSKLLKIINNLLDFNSMEQRKQIIKNETFNIDELLCECFSYFESDIDFSFRRTTDQVEIYNDKNKIKQVVMSILENAYKFSQKGISCKVKTTVYQINNEIYISFKDNGIGISKNTPNLFKEFTQEDNSSTREHTGVGLELTLCKKVLSQILGDILYKSSGKNQGTEFIIHFPLSAKSNSSSSTEYNAHVLIVEDDEINQEVASNYLKSIGITSEISPNGKEALALVKQNPHRYQLILMDCQMPIMDGYECTRELRKSGFIYPISAFTAHAYQEDKERCLAAGMNHFVTKPIETDPFNKMLTHLLPMSFENLSHICLDNHLNQGGESFLKGLLEKFIENLLNRDLLIIEQHLESKEYYELGRLFHKLKSTFGTFGFSKTQNLLKEYQKLEKFSKKEYIVFRNHIKSDLIALEKWCKINNIKLNIEEINNESI